MSGDLDELFSRLKGQSAEQAAAQSQSSAPQSIWTQQQQIPLYQQPSVSSPIFSPPTHTPNPAHASNVISPVNPSSMAGSPAPTDQSKTNSLLNLLRSSSHAGQSSSSAGPMANLQNVGRTSSGSIETLNGLGRDDGQTRPLSAQDLVASLQRGRTGPGLPTSRGTTGGAERTAMAPAPPSHDSKQFLLNLLKKPTSTTATSPPTSTSVLPSTENASLNTAAQSLPDGPIKTEEPARSQREPTPVRQFGSPDVKETAFEAPQPTKSSMFNYVNPFEQLHSSSPLNRTPNPEASASQPKKMEILKHERDVSSALNGESSAPLSKSRKVEGGPGSPSPVRPEAEKGQTVSEALEDVGEKVDKQVEQALKKADAQQKGEAANQTTETNTRAIEANDAGPVIKKEPGVDEGVDSSWESAEDDEADKDGDESKFNVQVFNLPMKAFVSIQIKDFPAALPIRQDSLTFIARMKKEFDQIDRNLVTASQMYIIYAPIATKKVLNPGLRIIQQEHGHHKHVFTTTNERVFNVQLCGSSAPGNDIETVLATGVDGTIFWTSLSKSRGELFADDDVEAQSFVMPPVATPEEQTSGSPVKTRAKVSSRHPEFFAVARGKHIHIIAPDAVKDKQYCNARTKIVNTEKYLAEHGLRIMTGKAGKDFCFSEDDSMIVSLDKSGRFKFWDIKELTSRAVDISERQHEPVELREPTWSLTAAASGSRPDEKPSVSSIMFLDKDKPTMKGAALRYMLIGFKQNHILQLWDLALGKAVQEIRLPHEKDSDGICSISYQPRNAIIAVGHPTRNSIYFIHLSAPMYRLPSMDQAKYISILARGDPSFPTPSSTAIMDGIRELSFAKVGQLRSLDMLRTPLDQGPDSQSDDAVLFELYAMHSKGVVGINVKKQDLGWNKDSKPLNGVDAVEAGVIELSTLITPERMSLPSEQSSVVDTPSKPPKSAPAKKQENAKPSSSAAAKNETVKRAQNASPAKDTPRTATPERGSKQVPEAPLPSQVEPTNPPIITAESYAMAAQNNKAPNRETTSRDVSAADSTTARAGEEPVSAPRVSSDSDLQAMITKQFDSLYQRIDSDKRVVDAAGAARQDAMLRLISSTLTENVEQSMTRIVGSAIEKEVLPTIANVTSKAAEKKVAEILPQQLNTHLSREIKATVPQAIQQALKDSHVQRSISDQVAAKVQQQVSQLLQQSLPAMATQAAQKMVADLDNRTKAQIHELETRHVQESGKIHELSELVRTLSETISNMSQSQVAFQEQVLKMQQQRPSSKAGTREQSSRDAAEPPAEPEDPEVARITQMLTNGQYDAATIEWLQSARQGELFDLIFVRVNPRYLEKVTPLVALSVSAAITASFSTHVEARLEWLATVLNNINMEDEEIRDVAGKIMDVLKQRLQGAYMQVSETNPGDTKVLQAIMALFKKVGEVGSLAG